ncbi:MAG TPA: 3-(3-hydroxyphenyl)propionate hydroxylase, partial [Pseudoduganella sp.]
GGRSQSRLVRGGQLPQGLVRPAPGAPCVLSDECLGDALTLVGFGCDPTQELSAALLADWRGAGGRSVTLRHRGQTGLHADAWEDMTDILVPGAAPVGWVAVVRPDRTVLHDGPLADAERVVRESLALMGSVSPVIDAVSPPVPS